MEKKRFVTFVVTCALAMGAAAGIASQASASTRIACSMGNGNFGIVSGFKTKLVASNATSQHEAAIKWAPPSATTQGKWYYGTASTAVTVYSPTVSTSNYPSMMSGFIGPQDSSSSVEPCTASVAASSY